MAITLTSEQEEMLRKDAANAGYEDAETFLAEKLEEAHEWATMFAANREQWIAQINEGLEQAERGELLSPEEVMASLERHKQEFLAKRTAA